ncbi:MAG: protein kinase [Acidobacteria bacterium]|nr:protein kinase [Acidobacteriota bacterium]
MKVCSVCERCFEDAALSCSDPNHSGLTEARAGSCVPVVNYRLERRLAATAKGETYRAVNEILKKNYLVRIVPATVYGGDREARELFLHEARALAAIVHPNLARVYESGVLADGSLYVVTEDLKSQSLRGCFENVGVPSETTALTITRQVSEGLEAIHAAGAFHRSLKPENIVLTTDADKRLLIKLRDVDFGGLGQRAVNAAPAAFLSDLRYFSPEQCGGAAADAQTDVYALGVVLYESLAGRVPFDAADADALVHKQLTEQPPPVRVNHFDIRMLLTHTLSDALQKMARLRLKTSNAFSRRLRHIEQLATHSPTPPPAIAYPARMNKKAVSFTPPAVKKAEPAPAAPSPAVEKTLSFAAEFAPVKAKPGPLDTQPLVAPPVPVAVVPEENDGLAHVIVDYTTTKLPPLESIIGDAWPVNEASAPLPAPAPNPYITFTGTVDELKAPALVEWEQPDDIPEAPRRLAPWESPVQKLDTAPEKTAEAAAAPVVETREPAPSFGSILGLAAAPPLRPPGAAPPIVRETPVFSSDEPKRSWKLPDKRKLLTAAAVLGLIVVSVGGTILNRRIQSARMPNPASSPAARTTPQTEAPVAENEKTVAPPAVVPVSGPVSEPETPDLSDLRSLDEPAPAPNSPVRNRKPAVKPAADAREKTPPAAKPSPAPNATLDKTGKAIPAKPDKKPPVTSKSTAPKSAETVTRPRIVRNP